MDAAAEAGIEKVQVVDVDGETLVAVRRTGLTESQKTRLALLDNRSAETAEWDATVLAAMAEDGVKLDDLFCDDELTAILGEVPIVEGDGGDEFDTTPDDGPTTVQPGEVWALGRHRLMCGDSTKAEDVGRLMDGAKAEMVWTDPPYGVSIGDKNKYLNSLARSKRIEENLIGDEIDEVRLASLLGKAFEQTALHCRAGAAWYVASSSGPMMVVFGTAIGQLGVWRQTIAWVKNNATLSPMGVDYHNRYEIIFYGWLPNAGHRYYGGRKQDTVWEIDRPSSSPEHPTMKPIELVARAVENSSKRGELIYDPFLGSGTTVIAAQRTGRVCYGMEIEPKYCDVIIKRYNAETGEDAVRVYPDAT